LTNTTPSARSNVASHFLLRIALLILLLFGTASISFAQEERLALRLITVRTEAEAVRLRTQSQAGVLFEELASAHSTDSSAKDGGYLGLVRPSDLTPELQRALNGLAPGQISAVTRLGGDYVLLQRMSVEETNWVVAQDAGLQAFQRNQFEEAAQHFKQAVEYGEKLTGMVHHLEDSLHALAETYGSQRKYAEAEPVYRRYIAVRWGGPGVPQLVDSFSTLLAQSFFKDSQFDEAFRKFEQALATASPDQDLYRAMTGILFKAELMPEAEKLIARAAQVFPESREIEFDAAQLHRSIGRVNKALAVFEHLIAMKPSPGVDPALHGLQQAVVYQKIGSIHAELVEFDKAIAAYKKALEITPDSAEAHLSLGDVYSRMGRPEDALTEYNLVVRSDPRNAAAYFRVADVNLRMGRFPEAAAAAERVLALDPAHHKAHYVLATAFVRMDRKDEAEKELALYRKLEADTRTATDRSRTIEVLNRGAAAMWLEGRRDEAVAAFLKLTETYPDAPAIYLNLGWVQSKLGRHQDAAGTFEKMLRLGTGDNFLVHWNLAQEYKLLGNTEGSRHQVLYLQKVDMALESALEWAVE
jgi:tetratricopeptide (TPR) repeat protein